MPTGYIPGVGTVSFDLNNRTVAVYNDSGQLEPLDPSNFDRLAMMAGYGPQVAPVTAPPPDPSENTPTSFVPPAGSQLSSGSLNPNNPADLFYFQGGFVPGQGRIVVDVDGSAVWWLRPGGVYEKADPGEAVGLAAAAGYSIDPPADNVEIIDANDPILDDDTRAYLEALGVPGVQLDPGVTREDVAPPPEVIAADDPILDQSTRDYLESVGAPGVQLDPGVTREDVAPPPPPQRRQPGGGISTSETQVSDPDPARSITRPSGSAPAVEVFTEPDPPVSSNPFAPAQESLSDQQLHIDAILKNRQLREAGAEPIFKGTMSMQEWNATLDEALAAVQPEPAPAPEPPADTPPVDEAPVIIPADDPGLDPDTQAYLESVGAPGVQLDPGLTPEDVLLPQIGDTLELQEDIVDGIPTITPTLGIDDPFIDQETRDYLESIGAPGVQLDPITNLDPGATLFFEPDPVADDTFTPILDVADPFIDEETRAYLENIGAPGVQLDPVVSDEPLALPPGPNDPVLLPDPVLPPIPGGLDDNSPPAVVPVSSTPPPAPTPPVTNTGVPIPGVSPQPPAGVQDELSFESLLEDIGGLDALSPTLRGYYENINTIPDEQYFTLVNYLLTQNGLNPQDFGITGDLMRSLSDGGAAPPLPSLPPVQAPPPVVPDPVIPVPPVVTYPPAPTPPPSVPGSGTVTPPPTPSPPPVSPPPAPVTPPPVVVQPPPPVVAPPPVVQPPPPAPAPPPVATPPPTTTPPPSQPPAPAPTPTPAPGTNPFVNPQNIDLTSQFNLALQGQGINPFGSAGSFISGDLFRPASTVFLASAPQFQGNNPFTQFLQQGGSQNLPSRGSQLFSDVLGADPNSNLGLFQDPTLGSDAAYVLGNLARLGLANQTNTSFASMFGQQLLDRIEDQFAFQQATAPTTAGTLSGAYNRGLGLGF